MDFVHRYAYLYLFAYYVVVSVVALLTMARDRLAARAERQRIAERNLYLLSAVGGWPGTWLACGMLRHKIRKTSFQMRLALATFLNIALAAVLMKLISTY